MTESAIEQRLRRYCTKRKNGVAPCGEDVLKKWSGDDRGELIEMFKAVMLDKAPYFFASTHCYKNIFPTPLCAMPEDDAVATG